MDQLLRIWQEVADVDRLRRKDGPWSSLFDGDLQFLDVVRHELQALIDGEGVPDAARSHQQAIARRQETAGYVDLQLSATLVEPVDTAAISPGDEQLRRSRSSARFHFRHDPAAVPCRLEVEQADVPRLAVAARGTASFPVAFEAAAVRATRPAEFEPRISPAPGVEPVAGESAEAHRARERMVDCRGCFSESRGPAKAGAEPFGDDDFVVADGGAVDNIPLGKALDAARDAPAAGPTRRVLVYLHPTGPSGVAGQAREQRAGESAEERSVRRRNLPSVISGLVASQIQSESIDGDLERLEAHNRTVRLGRVLRQTLLAELFEHAVARDAGSTGDGDPAALPPRPSGLARERLRSYFDQRAGADAEAIQRLLADPLAVLGEDPFPIPPEPPPSDGPRRHFHPDDRWRSPIAAWTSDQRLHLDTTLREKFSRRLKDRQLGMDVLVGGLGPISRSIDLLLELAREGEKQGADAAAAIGPLKPALYRLGSFVRELVRVRNLAWVCQADHVQPSHDVGGWVLATLVQLRRLTYCDRQVAPVLADPNGEGFAAAAASFLERCAEDLQTLTCGRELPVERLEGDDLREVLVAQLEVLAQPILDALPELDNTSGDDPEQAEPRSGAEVIQRVLADESEPEWAVRLASLEVLLVDEHLLGAPGLGEIGFTRMSAAAPIIDAARFEKLHAYSMVLDEPMTRDGHHLAPDVKLAGNELASFSAFLDQRWRINDWTWGRLDATATLVDLLLGEDRSDRLELGLDHERLFAIAGPEAVAMADRGSGPTDDRNRLRRALTAKRQAELLELAAQQNLPADPKDWRAGLETLVNPGSPELSRAVGELGSVAAQVVGATLPPRVPRVTGPLQGVLLKAARRFAKPTGVLPDAVRSALTTAGVETEASTAKLGFPWLALASVLAGAALAALAYAAADDSVSLAVGLVLGLVVGLVPGGLLLWLAVQPIRPKQTGRWYATAAAVGVLLGAGLTATITAALTAAF